MAFFNGKRVTGFLVLLLLLGMQLAVAQHATVHFSGHGHDYVKTGHDENPSEHSPHGDEKELCQFFATGFQSALAGEQDIAPAAFPAPDLIRPAADRFHSLNVAHSYRARAPPVFLS